eukprot:CAMPEP_0206586338 /NCGR_PEP_ID=MMETSP0325_2-20121206/36957_1 /ASSEMBLY_ACC=CAM_ASM_000347 /TAXON_ID=2866 /ORGANISM="Crypthecodinium cohnii, Strain Seligo" /LENGTH=364 /DNA_ID=CAMNT_0054094065 /DNA_START=26 /DNA_END=1118 /DNA_ORIENTATION=-
MAQGPNPQDGKICPVTGAVGYCPMAKPKGYDPNEKKPELKVLMMVVWEEGDSKVSIGVYPHLNKHWEALGIPDTSSKSDIRNQYRKLSVKYHPDKNPEESAKQRFQEINDAYEALKEVDGTLAFPWDAHPDKQETMTGPEALKKFGSLGNEAAGVDPIKAQMMQHVVKESTNCKVLMFESSTAKNGMLTKTSQVEALCEDERNGSNHLVKIYRRIVSPHDGHTGCDVTRVRQDEEEVDDDAARSRVAACSAADLKLSMMLKVQTPVQVGRSPTTSHELWLLLVLSKLVIALAAGSLLFVRPLGLPVRSQLRDIMFIARWLQVGLHNAQFFEPFFFDARPVFWSLQLVLAIPLNSGRFFKAGRGC